MAFTSVAALGATFAALISLKLGLAPLALFIGWAAFLSRPTSWSDDLATGSCVWLGIALGAAATLIVSRLTPVLGTGAAFAVTVFATTCVVVSFRNVPAVNNILAWCLGLFAFIAAHEEPSFSATLELAATVSAGMMTARLVQAVQASLSLR